MEFKNLFLILLPLLFTCTGQKKKLSEGTWHIDSYYTSDVSKSGSGLKKGDSPVKRLNFIGDSIKMDDHTFPYQINEEGFLIIEESRPLIFEISEITDKKLNLIWRDEDQKVHHFFSFTR